MDLRQLRSCIVIADSGSISEAARRMHIAQPALSERISELEQELGVTLFERSRRGILLTEAGSYFIEKARAILLNASELKADMQAKSGQSPVKLRIGISATLTSLFVPKLFDLCRHIAPDAEISLVEGVTHDLMQLIAQGGIDFAVSHSMQASASVMIYPLAKEPLCAIYRHHVISLPQPLTLQALLQHPLLVPHRAMALRALIEQHASLAGCTPKYAGDIDTLTGIVAAAQAGLGIAVLPKVALHGLQTMNELRVECIEPWIERTVSIAISVVSPNAAMSQLVGQHLRPAIDEWISSGQWVRAQAIGAGDSSHRQ
jgi:LysR family transcriptional regulator, nitrogen assimilation regulatory protein